MRAARRAGVTVALGATLLFAALGRGDVAGAPPVLRPISIKDSPGYVPLVDPESMSVVIGRRTNAPLVKMPFRGGASSLAGLGRAICRTLHHNAPDSMLALCITDVEFREILWPEFPQSRPATGLRWDDAWKILWARQHAGCAHAVRDHGGHVYQLVRIEVDSLARYRNFTLHSGLTMVVQDDEGGTQRWRWLRAVAEHNGRFKIYSTND